MMPKALPKSLLLRACGMAFGVITQVGFLATLPYLFLYLRYGGTQTGNWIAVDSLLALQFCIPHSLLLLPATRKWISGVIPSQFYGSFFALSTCATLWPIFRFWRSSAAVLWQAHGWIESGIVACFYLSWVALFFSLRASGFGYQTGWTQWLYWLRSQPLPRRPLTEHGPYRWLRHPAYLSFLGLIWFTPRMSADHAVLTTVWTLYIYTGSCLKDQRLLFYLGDTYREYAGRVPGYPGMLYGPLAKWPSPAMTIVEADGERSSARKAA